MNKNRKQLLDDMFDALSIMSGGNYVSLYDIKGRLTRFSPGAVELFGLPGEYIPDGADNWADHIHSEDKAYYQKVMGDLILCHRLTYDLTYRVMKTDGSYGLFRFKGAVIRDDNGDPSLVGGILLNEGTLDNTDPITVLRNRYGFFSDLEALQKIGQRCSVLLIGIDRLGSINEDQGYGFGNRLLRAVGWAIRDICGDKGYVYRMEGSKFALVAKDTPESELVKLYGKIRRRLRAGIIVDDVRQALNPCAAVIETDDPELTPHTIYTCLLSGYTESKEKRHGNIVLFNGSGSVRGINTLRMLSAIHDDILNGYKGFRLYYQPVFRLNSGMLIGVEALLRWHSDEYGEILPAQFLPVIEHDFAFSELSLWISRKAMQDGLKFFEKNDRMFLGINVSASQMDDDYFIPELIETAHQVGFPLERLIIEMSKDCRMLDPEIVRERTSELRSNGIRFLLDDFGSGFSSLPVLKALEADYIKLDQSYIENVADNPTDLSDLAKLAELCAAHGCDVCVKGIESAQVHDIIKNLPITSVQGFYYSAPVSASEILERVAGFSL